MVSGWRVANWLDNYYSLKQYYRRRYAKRMIRTPLVLKLRNGEYYARILGKEKRIRPDKIIKHCVIKTKGKQAPSLEIVVKEFDGFKNFKEKPNAVYIGDSKDYEDASYNTWRHTHIGLFRVGVNKYV